MRTQGPREVVTYDITVVQCAATNVDSAEAAAAGAAISHRGAAAGNTPCSSLIGMPADQTWAPAHKSGIAAITVSARSAGIAMGAVPEPLTTR